MIEFVFTAVVITLCTWSFVDIYLYSVWFAPIREHAEHWKQSSTRWKASIGFGLNCPYCLGHWIAAALTVSVMFFPNSFGNEFSWLEGLFLATLAARVSTMLRENVLRPIGD